MIRDLLCSIKIATIGEMVAIDIVYPALFPVTSVDGHRTEEQFGLEREFFSRIGKNGPDDHGHFLFDFCIVFDGPHFFHQLGMNAGIGLNEPGFVGPDAINHRLPEHFFPLGVGNGIFKLYIPYLIAIMGVVTVLAQFGGNEQLDMLRDIFAHVIAGFRILAFHNAAEIEGKFVIHG